MSRTIILGPVAFRIMGTYNSETEYEKLDVVLYENVSYVAKSIVQGQPPLNTEYWEPLGVSGADLSEYYTKDEVDTAVNAKYTKPNDGIPKTDLNSSVQTSLGLADTSIQDISGKQDIIDNSHKLSSDLVDDTDKTNKFVTSSEKAQITTNKNDITAIKDGQNIDSFSDVETELGLKEDKSNKVTEINSSSTDTQYPGAKCVYDYIEEKIGNIETILEELDIGSGV